MGYNAPAKFIIKLWHDQLKKRPHCILRRDSGAADTRVSGKYFYHTDHLGSANWVTKDDEVVQFIHYMPYGEMWYNQRGSAYNERYKYTGK